MKAFEKLFEQIPYFDGSYRRRLMTGLILIVSFVASYLSHLDMTGGKTITQSLTTLVGFDPVAILT